MENIELLGDNFKFQTSLSWGGSSRKITSKKFTERVKHGIYSAPEGSSIFFKPKSLTLYSTGNIHI
jgi:hypothetical protein